MLLNEKNRHRAVMLKIIREIYSNRQLGQTLGFKGGTAAYFFYDLPRFSVDLDFDLINPSPEKATKVFTEIRKVLSNIGIITDENPKLNTLLLELSYETDSRKLKVEISTREQQNQYQLLDLYGTACKVMTKEYMFACKLIALTRRNKLASRDLFDINFFLKQNWDIASAPVEEVIGKTLPVYLTEVAEFITEKFTEKNVLDGVGDLLDESQRQDRKLKRNLIDETLFMLRSRLG